MSEETAHLPVGRNERKIKAVASENGKKRNGGQVRDVGQTTAAATTTTSTSRTKLREDNGRRSRRWATRRADGFEYNTV